MDGFIVRRIQSARFLVKSDYGPTDGAQIGSTGPAPPQSKRLVLAVAVPRDSLVAAAEYHEWPEPLGVGEAGSERTQAAASKAQSGVGLQDVETETQRFLVRIPMIVNPRSEATLALPKILC